MTLSLERYAVDPLDTYRERLPPRHSRRARQASSQATLAAVCPLHSALRT